MPPWNPPPIPLLLWPSADTRLLLQSRRAVPLPLSPLFLSKSLQNRRRTRRPAFFDRLGPAPSASRKFLATHFLTAPRGCLARKLEARGAATTAAPLSVATSLRYGLLDMPILSPAVARAKKSPRRYSVEVGRHFSHCRAVPSLQRISPPFPKNKIPSGCGGPPLTVDRKKNQLPVFSDRLRARPVSTSRRRIALPISPATDSKSFPAPHEGSSLVLRKKTKKLGPRRPIC